MASRRIVLGIGNAERGDDAAGRAVARLFALHAPQALCNGWPSQRRVMSHVTPIFAIYRKPAATLRQGSGAPQGEEERRSLDGRPYPRLRLVARLDRT